ncbi:hypothetical protein [Salinimicrobium soli]|uniref:hypothetical protein n=1 Tax=Salinimicrobium soli TaxID=1254399 RepID=UPI003AAB9387
MKNLPKIETLTSLLWIIFGLVGGLNYISKEDYLISALFFLVVVLNGYRLVKPKNRNIKG